MMKLNLILEVLSAAAFGFFIGVSFPVQIAPQLRCYVLPWSGGGADADSTFSAINVLGSNKTAGEEGTATTPVLQPNATSEVTAGGAPPAGPKGAERLPPNIIVSESDLHMRRLWGNPRDDTPVRKYLLTMTVGYTEKDNVNATVHKFSDNFDVMLFHYDGKTTEWDDDFAWSKDAIHVSARKQAKWWYAKRFLHPSIVAPYDYVFLWDEDVDTTFFDAEEYLRIVRKHGLEISQPGLDATRGKTSYEVLIRRDNGGEIHKNTIGGPGKCPDVHRRPCSGFVEVMAPVFTREAWACAWHMVQNDLVHGWGLDLNFWRCVEDPEEKIGVVDAQYVAHRSRPTLTRQGNPETSGGGGGNVRGRAWQEFADFKNRIRNAERAQQAALAPPRPK